jgi:3-carboxy-cis,cis-muconate cycloisomerase
MPQKRNPIASSLTLAAASRVPGLVAAFLIQMVQEHERGVGGWQAESPTIAAIIQSTGVAVNSMAEAAEGLIINHERMRQNLSSTGGSVFAEKAVLMLTRKLGRERSHELLRKATDPKWMRGRSVSEVLLDMPEIKAHLINRKLLSDLDDPQQYLGSAQKFAKRLTRSASGGARPRR